MKNLLYTFLFVTLLVLSNTFAQTKAPVANKEAGFKKLCSEIVNAFAKKDMAFLNKNIQPDAGIYIMTRPGAMDNVVHQTALDEKQPFTFAYPYKDLSQVKKHKVTFGTAPKYDCGTQKWDKKGFVADSAVHYNRITDVMYMVGKYGGEKVSDEEIAKIKALESNSRKVVFTELSKGKGIVFYLSLIKGKWYLLLIDTVASSCEA